MSSQNVEVKLELGHRACILGQATAEGFTHEWTLFVRGSEGCHIEHYVEKVVFFLHESFSKPKRVRKEPPYHVIEKGYAGFNLAIEVHFRNKEDPKKVHFDYDLYLHLEGPPIHNFRLEKLTFQNPNQEFRKKLLKGGGVAISGSSQSSNSNPVHTETEQTPKSKSIRSSNEGPKKTPKVKLPHTAKDFSSPKMQEVPPKVPETSHQPFTQIFGAPIKSKPPSSDTSQKSKDITKEKSISNSSSSKTTSAPAPSSTTLSSSSSSSSLQNTSSKSASKDSHKTSFLSKDKVSKGTSKETEKKENKSSSESKSSSHKRSSSPPPSQGHKSESSTIKKRKRSTSTSSTTSSVAENKSFNNKENKTKVKDSKKEHGSSTNQKNLPTSIPPKKESQKPAKPSQVVPRKEQRELKSPASSVNNDQESISLGGRARLESESSDSSSSSADEKEVKPEEVESRSSVGSASSPSSSLTLSSITPGSAHGPLATMMAQMEQELVSPLSSDQASPTHSVLSPKPEESPPSPPSSPMSPPTPVKVEEPPTKKSKEKRQNEKHVSSSKKTKDEVEKCLPPPLPSQTKSDGKPQAIDAAYLHELMQLQEQIMALRDKQHLQRIVDVIEETGKYQITSSTIDFDLCALDRSTVQKLQNCMTVT